MRAIVQLLDRLKLDAIEAYPGDDIAHVVSRRFSRYQSMLIRAFNYIKIGELGENDNISSTSSTSNVCNNHILGVISLEHFLFQRKNSIEREIEIRDLIITGLAHLILANSEIGFKHSLSLAQDEDPRKRAIFCYAVAKVLGCGTKFEPPSNTALVVRRGRLCEVFIHCSCHLKLRELKYGLNSF